MYILLRIENTNCFSVNTQRGLVILVAANSCHPKGFHSSKIDKMKI